MVKVSKSELEWEQVCQSCWSEHVRDGVRASMSELLE